MPMLALRWDGPLRAGAGDHWGLLRVVLAVAGGSAGGCCALLAVLGGCAGRGRALR
eukprot:CAMPEP_0174340994 /NCGR_PEP_ID=MMETSP0810-20121108/25048_1 /TAXON_ID=73025 ORGANISM="Eutreptiella gymnastica-like, Strain CCMP1594" /NCGR_SAMPLE_ID=MMETSP0810 /ASSEMBLY_ACC=CAM_ASM_000659 /LENGTH=55 /DNA_ID=CAMNT_0015462347 /DNA_START=31 /DNA_END=195 /DNA_ORIENTATION=+